MERGKKKIKTPLIKVALVNKNLTTSTDNRMLVENRVTSRVFNLKNGDSPKEKTVNKDGLLQRTRLKTSRFETVLLN